MVCILQLIDFDMAVFAFYARCSGRVSKIWQSVKGWPPESKEKSIQSKDYSVIAFFSRILAPIGGVASPGLDKNSIRLPGMQPHSH